MNQLIPKIVIQININSILKLHRIKLAKIVGLDALKITKDLTYSDLLKVMVNC